MKALYFDCASGISGNMTLGALMELCDDPEYLVKELLKLNVGGYHLHISKQIKNGITGTYVDVALESEGHHHHHDHGHEHGHECSQGHEHEHHHDHECCKGHSHEHGHECSQGHEHEHHHDHECCKGHSHEHDHECCKGHSHEHDHECCKGHSHEHHHSHVHEQLKVSKQVQNENATNFVDVHLENSCHSHHHDHEHVHNHDHNHGHAHDHGHHHDHGGDHVHRNIYDVNEIIDNSSIDEKAKDLAKRIFLRVAKAESKVHNESLENVHFHEVGAIDSIVDIIGTAILITHLNPDVIYSSVVNDGHGFINCDHGMIAVPVPATTEIFAASDAITRQIDIDTELVTPTGAAIIAELASSFGVQPPMNVTKIGWGTGSKDLEIPNVLKVSLGETGSFDDGIIVMETNIDDCTGEIMAYTMERLFEAGALDVFFTPIYMKKNRPAYRLTVSCKENTVETLKDIIFSETTTIGIRYRKEDRFTLKRDIKEMETSLGKVKIKATYHGDKTYEYPEFEDLRRIAQETGLPLKEVYNDIFKK